MWVELVSGVAIALVLWIVIGRYHFQQSLFNPQACSTSESTLRGKIALITGANSGLGFATAEELVRRGCHVYLACRSPQRGKQAEAKLNMRYSNVNGAGFAQFIKLDLSDTRNIRDLAWKLKNEEKVRRLDYLINNAGIGGVRMDERSVTKEQCKMMMRVNWFHPWILTESLLSSIEEIGRVIFVSSVYHSSLKSKALHSTGLICDSEMDTYQSDSSNNMNITQYSSSFISEIMNDTTNTSVHDGSNDNKNSSNNISSIKVSDVITERLWDWSMKNGGLLVCWLQTYALSKYLQIVCVKYILQRKYEKLRPDSVKFVSVNPGFVRTNIWDYSTMPLLMKYVSMLVYPFVCCVWRDCRDGCQTIVDACVNPRTVGGEYYSNCSRDLITHPIPNSLKSVVESLTQIEFKLN